MEKAICDLVDLIMELRGDNKTLNHALENEKSMVKHLNDKIEGLQCRVIELSNEINESKE